MAAVIRNGSGRHFDPDVVTAFIVTEKEFEQIAEQYADIPAEDPLQAIAG